MIITFIIITFKNITMANWPFMNSCVIKKKWYINTFSIIINNIYILSTKVICMSTFISFNSMISYHNQCKNLWKGDIIHIYNSLHWVWTFFKYFYSINSIWSTCLSDFFYLKSVHAFLYFDTIVTIENTLKIHSSSTFDRFIIKLYILCIIKLLNDSLILFLHFNNKT